MRSESVHIRLDPDVKQSAEGILSNLGLTTTDAINMFLRQIIYCGGIPFDVKMPNAVTRAAMREGDEICKSGEGFDDIEDMFKELDGNA